MRTGGGDVGGVDVEEDFTFRAIMHGISKLDKDGASFRTIAEMTEFAMPGPMLAAVVTAMGTRTFNLNSRLFFDDGLGQIVDVADSFRGIGQIITGLWHGGNLIETRVQGDHLPHFEISVNTISQLLCYSLKKFLEHNIVTNRRKRRHVYRRSNIRTTALDMPHARLRATVIAHRSHAGQSRNFATVERAQFR